MARKLTFSVHAVRRMFERRISPNEVGRVLDSAKTIESYPDDEPYPSRLVLGWVAGRPVHVVVADNTREDEIIVVTLYEPDTRLWEPGFERRKP